MLDLDITHLLSKEKHKLQTQLKDKDIQKTLFGLYFINNSF